MGGNNSALVVQKRPYFCHCDLYWEISALQLIVYCLKIYKDNTRNTMTLSTEN